MSNLPQEEKKANVTSEINSLSTYPNKLLLFHKEKHQPGSPGSLTHNQKQQQKKKDQKANSAAILVC